MNILLVLIPVSLLVVIVAVRLFFWAVNHQQFDDLDSPATLPLMDDPPGDPSSEADQPAAPGPSDQPPAGS
jgi:cbb3-type cytochrome oxidase maturation protein